MDKLAHNICKFKTLNPANLSLGVAQWKKIEDLYHVCETDIDVLVW